MFCFLIEALYLGFGMLILSLIAFNIMQVAAVYKQSGIVLSGDTDVNIQLQGFLYFYVKNTSM